MSFTFAIVNRTRKSPFFDSTVAAGVSHFTTYNHMCMPISYGDFAAEYDRLINGVAMWDVSVERQVQIKGRDAMRLVKMLTPRNLDNLAIGQGKYAPICNRQGILLNDPVLLQISEDEFWLSIADSDVKLWAGGVAAALNLDVEVSEPDVSPLAVQGPKAKDVIGDLFGSRATSLKHFAFFDTDLDGIPLIVARSGWSKQDGFELYLRDGRKGKKLWDLVAKAGAPYNIGPGAPNYIERLESGLISFGTDTDDTSNLYEMGLGKLCDLSRRDDFIGKAALEKIAATGISRLFCGVILDGTPLTKTNEHRCPASHGGQHSGYVSAATWSPRLQQNIGVGIIAKDVFDEGKTITVDIAGGTREGKTAALPFISRNTKTPESKTLKNETQESSTQRSIG